MVLLSAKLCKSKLCRHRNRVCSSIFVPPSFCLCFALTGLNFQGMLHHGCDVAYDENMCGPVRTHKCKSTN